MDHLRGLRVLSFNHFLMGPVGVQFLADLGADVIAVEPPDGAFQRKWGGANKQLDGQTMLLLAGNRNKRSLAIDLKHPDGAAIVRKLIAQSDVICENYRPGVMDRLGFGYEAARAIKPDIIYAAASGFGADGPYLHRPGQDLIVQALSGLAAITGTRAGPRAVGVSVIDHHGAALLAAGILGALLKKERTGVGGRVDVSLLQAAIDLQMESFTCYLNGPTPDDVRQPDSVAGWYFGAPYGVYETSDGHVVISLGALAPLYDVLDVPSDERVSEEDHYERREEAAKTIADRLRTMSTETCVAALEAARIWHAPVNDYADVVRDPQVIHNRSFTTVPGVTGTPITLVNHPVRYDGAVPEVRLPPQRLGAQTNDILSELGYGAQEIEALLGSKVVAGPPPA